MTCLKTKRKFHVLQTALISEFYCICEKSGTNIHHHLWFLRLILEYVFVNISRNCSRCRKTQAVYDKCVSDNLGIQRPPFGYFCEVKVHDTKRPKPEPKKPDVYPDYTPYLPDDYPRPPAKYGSRFHWMD